MNATITIIQEFIKKIQEKFQVNIGLISYLYLRFIGSDTCVSIEFNKKLHWEFEKYGFLVRNLAALFQCMGTLFMKITDFDKI